MPKEVRGIDRENMESMSLDEFIVLPGLTRKVRLDEIDVTARLADDIILKYPYLPAAMRSVTGYEMALEAARNGMMAVVPVSLGLEQQVEIVKKVKQNQVMQGDVVYHDFDRFVYARNDETLGHIRKKIEKDGHSIIPIVDEYGRYLGVYTYNEDHDRFSGSVPVKSIMTVAEEEGIDYLFDTVDRTVVQATMKELDGKGRKYMAFVDEQRHLKRIGFVRKLPFLVGGAISTQDDWEERLQGMVSAGIDMVFIDASDGYSEWQSEVIEKIKEGYTTPLCAGNIVTREGFLYLAERGADVVKIGMGIGSICTTTEVKGIGRGQATALIEVYDEREKFSRRYIPLIGDGEIASTAQQLVALTFVDAAMMGKRFNALYEAAGKKFDENKQPTSIDDNIRFVETFGEGSRTGKNLGRYDGETMRTHVIEGDEGFVCYEGKLKPCIEGDVNVLRNAMRNRGVRSLRELRQQAVVEHRSEVSMRKSGSYIIKK